jgi:hypothetical protein
MDAASQRFAHSHAGYFVQNTYKIKYNWSFHAPLCTSPEQIALGPQQSRYAVNSSSCLS